MLLKQVAKDQIGNGAYGYINSIRTASVAFASSGSCNDTAGSKMSISSSAFMFWLVVAVEGRQPPQRSTRGRFESPELLREPEQERLGGYRKLSSSSHDTCEYITNGLACNKEAGTSETMDDLDGFPTLASSTNTFSGGLRATVFNAVVSYLSRAAKTNSKDFFPEWYCLKSNHLYDFMKTL